MSIFYVSSNGTTDEALVLHSGHYNGTQITIIATGTTRDMVDWQLVGRMFCVNIDTMKRKEFGLVWDESRVLTDYEGDTLSAVELRALAEAGFNTENFR